MGVCVGALKRPLDRRVDRASEAAELFVVFQLQLAGAAIFEKELFEGEGEQRQGVAAPAPVDVLKQSQGQLRFDRKVATHVNKATRRPLDHVIVSLPRHRQERHRALRQPFKGFRVLQGVVGIRTDRENHDHYRLLLEGEITENL